MELLKRVEDIGEISLGMQRKLEKNAKEKARDRVELNIF